MDDQKMNKKVDNSPIADTQEWPNVTFIINVVIDVVLGNKSKEQAIIEILAEYKDAVSLHIETSAKQKIDEMISSSPKEGIRELSRKEFSDRIVRSTKVVAANVYRFYRKEISLQQFVDSLCNDDLTKVVNDSLEALGIPQTLGIMNADSIWLMSSYEVAYAALTEVYKRLKQALEDAHIAHERRLKIEAECAEAVACITRYRTQMEQIVSEHLKVRYDIFESGFV